MYRSIILAFLGGLISISSFSQDHSANDNTLKLGVNLRAGIIQPNVKLTHFRAENASTNPGIRLDAELELKPDTENSFALLLNLGYENFTSDGVFSDLIFYNESRTATRRADQPWQVRVSNLALGLGVRQYFKVSKAGQLFLDGLFQPNVTLASNSEFEIYSIPDLISPGSITETEDNFHLAFGTGYKIKNLSAHFRYFINKYILPETNGDDVSVKYSSINLTLGYSF